jgi:hypothetical protein
MYQLCEKYKIAVAFVSDCRMARNGQYTDFGYYKNGYFTKAYQRNCKGGTIGKRFIVIYNEHNQILLLDKEVNEPWDSSYHVEHGVEDSEYLSKYCK